MRHKTLLFLKKSSFEGKKCKILFKECNNWISFLPYTKGENYIILGFRFIINQIVNNYKLTSRGVDSEHMEVNPTISEK